MPDPNSPFYHDWPDPADRERFEIHAREVYVSLKEDRRTAFESHVAYGKWLIASLLALHAGSIYVLMTLQPVIDAEDRGALFIAAGWNVFGIASIMLAGFFAWLNFQVAEQQYLRMTTPAMLYRMDQLPRPKATRFDPIMASLYFAATSGVFSWVALIFAAVELIQALRT